jgi:hypothetical protein
MRRIAGRERRKLADMQYSLLVEMRTSGEGKMAQNRAGVQEQVPSGSDPSRRDVLRTATAIAVSATGTQLLAGEAAAQNAGGATLEHRRWQTAIPCGAFSSKAAPS